MFWKPVKQEKHYPIDLDGSLKFTRFAKTKWQMPAPPMIGRTSGFLPLQNAFIWRNAMGKMPSGPNISLAPLNLTYQITIPELAKSGKP